MPNKNSHLELAKKNEDTIKYLLSDADNHPEWIATVAFYRALHLVEALFSVNSNVGTQHGSNHEQREKILKSDRRYSHIWKHYRPLWAASMVSRYLKHDAPGHGYYASFCDFMSAQDVKDKILNHRLKQIETSVDS